MDDILRGSKKREKRADLTLGLLVVAGAAALLFGFNALGPSGGYSFYILPLGAFGFGASRVVRGLSG